MQMILRSRPILFTTALVLTAGRSAQEHPTFFPADGEQWERSYVEQTSWILEDVSIAMDGIDLTVDPPDFQATSRRRVVITSEVEVDDDGLVQAETRNFEVASGECNLDFHMDGEASAFEFELESPLEGESVVFTRLEQSDEWDLKWLGNSDRDDALLKGLSWPCDYQALLPGEEVERGDTWDVDTESAWTLLAPLGDLHIAPEEDTLGDQTMPTGGLVGTGLFSVGDVRPEEFEGDIEVTFSGVEERDDLRLAILTLRVDGSLELERQERFAAALELVSGLNDPCDMSSAVDIEGDGILLWDLDRGLPFAMDLTLEISAEIMLSWPEELGDPPTQFETTLEISGETVFKFRHE